VEDELAHDAEDDHSPVLIQQSLYYDSNDFIELLKSKGNVVKIISLNCQSLNAKIDDIRMFIDDVRNNDSNIDILCLQETWLNDSAEISHLQIDGYTLISKGKTCSAHGGVATYISNKFHFSILPVESHSNSWDGQFIEIKLKYCHSN
jgi:exonuclease III